MVSTRGVKVKFSEGERVLCYEPDPTKAKVLYDSKVLQVVHTKDSKGRKQVEYLIHFQNARHSSNKNATVCKGWNASWDRRVSEDFVLKDTEENRDLQRDLAEKAHIKLSIKSNRVLLGSGSTGKERKRRRRLSETIRETIEREREKKNRTESDTSSQTGTGTTEDDMESISSSGMGSTTTTTNADQEEEEEEEEENEMSDDETISKLVPVPIPESLKDVIEKDFFFINEKNKLVNLPSRKSVLSILEDYVRFFALRYLARSREKRRSEPRERDKAFMTLDLCKEVVDGLRICFDFYVHTLLLYPRERQQAEKLKLAIPIKTEVFKYESEAPSTNPVPFKDPAENQDSKSGVKPTVKEKEEKKCDSTPQRMLRSKKPLNEEFALVELKDVPRGQPLQQQQQQPHPPLMQQQHPHPQSLSCESGRSTPTTLTSGTSLPEGTLDSNYSEGERFGIPQQFKELHNWTLLPLYNRVPPTPVLLYGPNHLLRLFVKMPEILYRMNVPSDRKKVILHHISLFLDYLSLHIQDLFPDSNYVDYIEN